LQAKSSEKNKIHFVEFIFEPLLMYVGNIFLMQTMG